MSKTIWIELRKTLRTKCGAHRGIPGDWAIAVTSVMEGGLRRGVERGFAKRRRVDRSRIRKEAGWSCGGRGYARGECERSEGVQGVGGRCSAMAHGCSARESISGCHLRSSGWCRRRLCSVYFENDMRNN